MVELRRTKNDDRWLRELYDRRAKAKILQRMDSLREGNPGDAKTVGNGVMEMRIDYGPGYRVYYTHRGKLIVVLLCGGDKSTQQKDIEQAKALAAQLEGDQ